MMHLAFPLLAANVYHLSGDALAQLRSCQAQLLVTTAQGHLALEQTLEVKPMELVPRVGSEDQQQTRFAAFEVLVVFVVQQLAVAKVLERTAEESAEDAGALFAWVLGVWCHLHILEPDFLVVEHAMIARLELEQYHFVERQQNHSAVAALHDFQARDVHQVGIQIGMELVPAVTVRKSQESEFQTGCLLLKFVLHLSAKEQGQFVHNSLDEGWYLQEENH